MTANPVRDEAVQIGGGRLTMHVKVAGEGPPLVFFHGLAGLAWEPLLGQLAGQYTVYAPEHPGTSPSDPKAIDEVRNFWELMLGYEELVRALGMDRPAAVGQSYGGMVAADLAATFPRLFSRLVLLSPAGLAGRRSDPPRGDGVRAARTATRLPVRAPRRPGRAGDDGAARRPGADPRRDRAASLEHRLHHQVRLADPRPRARRAGCTGSPCRRSWPGAARTR